MRVLTIFFISLLLGMSSLSALAKDEFVSIVGQEIQISINENYVTTKIGQVSIKHICNDKRYVFCFKTGALALSFPRAAPDEGSTWTNQGITFRVLSIMESFYIFGNEFKNIFVIEANPLQPKANESRAVFLYSDVTGLIAFSSFDGMSFFRKYSIQTKDQ